MSAPKDKKSRVVVTTDKKEPKKALKSYRNKRLAKADEQVELPFSKMNFLWMGGGFVVMLLGMALMVGGRMPSPDVWDPELIYGFRQTVLSPAVILAGIGIIIYGIFKREQ